MAKKKNDKKDYVRVDLAFSTLLPEHPYMERMQLFLKENKIVGNFTWDEFHKLDSDFATEFAEYTKENEHRLSGMYQDAGANIEKIYYNPKKKAGKKTKKVVLKTKEQKTIEAKDLITQDINSLSINQVKSVMTYGNLEFKDLEPYYKRLQYLNENPQNYNRPNYVKAAQGFLTFNFSGKSNPIKWIECEEVIMPKLYGAKRAIEYLEKTDKKALKAALTKAKPKLDSVLKELGYKDINEIKF